MPRIQFYNGLVSDSNQPCGDDARGTLMTKLIRFNNIIQVTYIHIMESKRHRVLKINDIKQCSIELMQTQSVIASIHSDLQKIDNLDDELVSRVQKVNVDISNIIKKWGTRYFDDFIYVCFGKDYKNTIVRNVSQGMINIIERQFHPLRYIMFSMDGPDNSIIGTPDLTTTFTLAEIKRMNIIECFNVSAGTTDGSLYIHTHGMVMLIKNDKMKAGMFVFGIVDHIDIDIANSVYIHERYNEFIDNIPIDIESELFANFLHCMSTKEWLVHNTALKVYSYYKGGLVEHKLFKHHCVSAMANEFIAKSIFTKRQTILYFLIDEKDSHGKYIAYFLYDLLTIDPNNMQDSMDQVDIINSFTSKMHELFNNSLVETLQYTTRLNKLDANKINIEQQICLMKTDDIVKEKAMVKLREVKSKSDDGGSKARHYLDGLLKIPFGIYRKEPIMCVSEKIKEEFDKALTQCSILSIVAKETGINVNKFAEGGAGANYTVADIRYIINCFYNKFFVCGNDYHMESVNICKKLNNTDRKSVIRYVDNVNKEIQKKREKYIGKSNGESCNMCPMIINIKKTKENIVSAIGEYITSLPMSTENENKVKNDTIQIMNACLSNDYIQTNMKMVALNNTFDNINTYLKNVNTILDKAAYGHVNAKNQLIRIIGQWINGEHNGYCFGFEGAAGVGKTSLCKYGLANCLVDGDGNPRPFAMIAMGGDSNGSTLHGHNYTYVGSTWGSIVNILMDKTCMNPIIFIDELDKISKTEHGRELVGILIHMLDPTQNDKFQDKYFAGIDIDLSRVLFVLSYNDVDSIDRILLDRIHRVKFSSLSLEEKIHISKEYTLPEIYKKNGLAGAVHMGEDVIRYIIENYTCEPGVRKLREKLFEVVSEINIRMLKQCVIDQYPIIITIDDIKNIYFKDMRPVTVTMVPSLSRIGYANGLWANAHGQGGTLPIEAYFYPSGEFLKLKLTGKQGDVMQESMNVAMTLAYKLCPKELLEKTIQQYNGNIKYGIHIHTPEGATPKDGPSAGSCITVVIYSLLSNKSIKAKCGMTGEIQLTGAITAIGGLDAKILGSLKSGITTYFYPKENEYDFNKFYDKYKDKEEVKGISFKAVSTIEELLHEIVEP